MVRGALAEAYRPRGLRELACVALFVLLSGAFLPARGQDAGPAVGQQAAGQSSDDQRPGSIKGQVVDQSGATIAKARAVLSRGDGLAIQETLTDDNGQFSFANVGPGPFKLTISAVNLTPQTIDDVLHPGEAYASPLIMLGVATQMTEVRVAPPVAEQAQLQVEQEEKQRVFGIIPNFYVTYATDPVPLPNKLKFQLAWKSLTDPFTFAAVGVVAGAEQAGDQWSRYGQGAEGYAKRYGASYADVTAGTYIGSAILPAVFRQDPRYYYKGTGSKKLRFLHAIAASVICRGDNGRTEFNYSNVLGSAAAGSLSTLYYPSNRSAGSIVLSTTVIRLGETVLAGVFQEFLSQKVTPDLPDRTPR